MEKSIRIVAMSDTHDLHHKININGLPKGDIFIHAGDFTKLSLPDQMQRFRQFLKLLPYKHKVVIAGNHDFVLDRQNYKYQFLKTKHKHVKPPMDPEQEIKKLKQCCIYLEHDFIEIQGVKIFGSPYQPYFCDWGFMYNDEESQKIWSTIPKDIDILITHGPPFGILDLTIDKVNAGCKGLLKMIQIIKPQVHIFGHIHQGHGTKQINGVRYYNVSTVNVAYRITYQPVIIDIIPKFQNQKQQN